MKKYSRNHLPSSIWRDPIQLVTCGLGAGAMPVAPGTFGTLVAIPVYLLLFPLSVTIYTGLLVALFVLGVWLCAYTARALRVHDHPGIVWDEIVGYLITMTAAPFSWKWILAGFFLFRFFDIVKPWPIRWLDERIPGGLGIMLDDVLAGFYAAVCLQLVIHFEVININLR